MHGSNRTNLFTITAPDGQLSGGGLHGRRGECQTLDRLAANARSGHSQVLVLRGEPGIGKTALLDYLAGCAAGCRIARVAGAEPETELALAGLHQLCAPFLDRLGQLPGPQRDALRTAFSMRDGNLPDRFAVGLATLSLLAEVAAERPLICVIDDARWLDRASAQVLGFVARHLAGVPLTVVFAVRQPDGEQDLAGLPELVVGALTDGDARALLHSAVIGPLDERVRDRIVAETRGNPLALLEVLAALPPAELAGGFGLPGTRPLDPRAEESYRRRLAPLPPATRLLLLIAAAELAGDPVTVWRAAGHLGLEPGTADPATAAGLIEFTGRVRFCHPSARAAIYQAASPRQRHDVHRALAQATDPEVNPDHRAWHLGHATPGLDEDVAAGLERAARRTKARGALAAAAVLGERAAELTPGPARRASRALDAARAHHEAGAPDVALRLLAMAQAGPLDEPGQARAELLHAQTAVHPDRGLLLLKAAERLEPLDAGLAREAYRGAFDAALTAGRLDGGMRRVAEAVRAAPPGPEPPRVADALLAGLATLVIEGPAAGAPLLADALRAARAEHAGSGGDVEALRWLPFACRMSEVAWDDESWAALSARQIEVARQAGALTVLPSALAAGVAFRLGTGELAMAASMSREAAAIARAAGDQADPQGPALIAAWRGQEAEAGRLIAAATTEMVARGEGQWLTAAVWATAVLYNGLGRYDEALATAERVGEDPGELGLAAWALAELIEAAARTGAPERAAGALRRLTEVTGAAATDWALGILARSRALLADGVPEPLYLEAIERLGRTRIRAELARAHLLYGEWLRRHGRRSAAREQLRTAYEMLDAMGIAAFAERARRELVATGETARKRTTVTADGLTAQETQIAMLACHGHSNPEISTQLFISPRTVEWHLRKVFGKLGISSRKELRTVLPDLGQVPLSA